MRPLIVTAALAVLGVAGPTAPPAAVTVATARGVASIPVRSDRGHPALSTLQLQRVLTLAVELEGGWAEVALGGQPFRFLLDAAVMEHGGRLVPLAGGAYLAVDTLFVPLQWLTDYVPRVFREAYHYDPLAARFEEASLAPTVRTTTPSGRASNAAPDVRPSAPAPAAPRPAGPPRRGRLRMSHSVVVDAGHGGTDPGNPGLYFPRGVREKDVTLALARLLRAELVERGIAVTMTRATDTLIDLRDRASRCGGSCDLFVSLHVNSLPRRGAFRDVSGFETYFLDQARTAEAQRVAQMENDALRYETARDPADDEEFAFILKDLATNEYLRESATLAEAVQERGSRVHPGKARGVSQARFVVLSMARRPAILVETGFSTNRSDARFLTSREGQQRLAEAIAEGIVDYLEQYEHKLVGGQP